MKNQDLIKAIVELAREVQAKQTRDVLEMVKDIPETAEIKQLKERLIVADQKINTQCDFVLKLDRIARKSALLN